MSFQSWLGSFKLRLRPHRNKTGRVRRPRSRKSDRGCVAIESLEVRSMLSGSPLTAVAGTAGLWHLDEDSGNSTADSGGSNPGTLVNGPVWVTGNVGSALKFDGINDYVNVKNGAILGSAPNFTVEAWIQWDGGGTSHQHQFIYSEGSFNDIIDLYLDNGVPSFTTLGSNWYTASASAALPVGEWHHLAGVLQAGVGGTLYLDGQPVATNPNMGPGSQFAGSTDIGRTACNGSLRYFRGTIDEVRVMTVAQSAAQILADYQQGLNNNPDPAFAAQGGFVFAATEGTLSADQPVATFTGPGGAGDEGNYSASIDWGDGSPSSPGTISFSGKDFFWVNGSHLYAHSGSYNVVTTITGTSTPGTGEVAWATNSAMPTPRWASAAGAINGVIYLAGGYVPGSHLQTVQAYDTTTNTWVNKNNKPAVQTNTAYGVIDGILYTAGGTNSSVEITSLYAYAPTTDTWTSKASMPGVARQNSGGAVSNGLFYVMGGFSLGNPTNLNYAYNPASNTWSNALAPMPTPRTGLAVAAVNGTLYAIGGYIAGGGFTTTVEAYDPVSNTWTTKAAMPTARADFDVAVVNGIIYAIGGTDYTTQFATVEAYDPATNSWITQPSMSTARIALETAVVNNVIYAIGGYNNFPGGVALGANESWTPAAADNNSSTTSTLNFDAVNASAGPVDASSYLAGSGITLSAVTAGTAIDVVNNQSVYGGAAASPSSSPNMLMQINVNAPVSYTLNFATPLTSLGFTRPMLLAGPSGITHPQWSAHAFDASGQEVASASEGLIASYSNVPASTFTLTGDGITSVRFDSNGYNFTAFSAVLIDDLTITTTSATTSATATSSALVSAANHPPTANAFGPYTDNEGGSLTLDASHSSDADQPSTSLTYLWDLDNDGEFGETGNAAEHGDEVGVHVIFSAAGLDGPSTYSVSLRVLDDGGLTSTDTAIINITNWEPNAYFSGGGGASLGTPVTVNFGNANDLSPADATAGFHYAFALDPSSLAGANYANSGTDASATFTFTDGLFQHTIYGRILDKDDGYTDYSTVVREWLLTPPSPTEGIPTGRVRVLTFASEENPPSDGTIYWGDGASSAASFADGTITRNDDGTFSAWGEHTYLHAATGLIFSVGGNDEGSEDHQSFSALIDVADGHDAPLTLDDSTTTDEDTAVTLNVFANDTDVDSPTSQWRIDNFFDVSAEISLTDLEDGYVQVTPVPNFHGTATFGYRLSDGDGGSDDAMVTITVNSVNDAPIANGTLADVTVNQNAANTVVSLAGMFSDVDTSDSLTITAVSSSSGLVMTSVSPASLMLDYQPNQSGSATIIATATDGSGVSVSITLDVHVLSPQQQSAIRTVSKKKKKKRHFSKKTRLLSPTTHPAMDLLCRTAATALPLAETAPGSTWDSATMATERRSRSRQAATTDRRYASKSRFARPDVFLLCHQTRR